jgi:hypothetical protein
MDQIPLEPDDGAAGYAESAGEEVIGAGPADDSVEAGGSSGGEDTPSDAVAETCGVESDERAEHAASPGRFSSVARICGRFTPEGLKRLWNMGSVGKAALVAVVAYAVLCGGFYVFLFRPAEARVTRLTEELGVLQDFLVIEQANAALERFNDGLMEGDQRLTVMSEFKLMAETAGVRIVGDPELLLPREVSELVTEYPVRLRLKGTYHEIGKFLSLLEGSPRFVQIEEVEILSEAGSRDRESEASVLLALASWEE